MQSAECFSILLTSIVTFWSQRVSYTHHHLKGFQPDFCEYNVSSLALGWNFPQRESAMVKKDGTSYCASLLEVSLQRRNIFEFRFVLCCNFFKFHWIRSKIFCFFVPFIIVDYKYSTLILLHSNWTFLLTKILFIYECSDQSVGVQNPSLINSIVKNKIYGFGSMKIRKVKALCQNLPNELQENNCLHMELILFTTLCAPLDRFGSEKDSWGVRCFYRIQSEVMLWLKAHEKCDILIVEYLVETRHQNDPLELFEFTSQQWTSTLLRNAAQIETLVHLNFSWDELEKAVRWFNSTFNTPKTNVVWPIYPL